MRKRNLIHSRLIIAVLLFVFSSNHFKANAQQDPMYTQYMFNTMVYNPAFTGTEKEFMCITILHHNQWLGFGGGDYVGNPPTTTTFSFNAPFDRSFSGIGLYAIEDKLGWQYTRSMHLTGSGRVNFSFGTLQGGINLGMIEAGIDPNWNAHDPDDPELPASEKDIKPDLGLGLYLFTNRYFLAFSAQHILPIEFYWNQTEKTMVTHFYISGGVNLALPSNPNLRIQPSILIKSDKTKMQFDINTNIMYKERFWGGLQYKSQSSLSVLLGMKLSPQLKFGYSYDLTTNEIRKYNSGTHEIMINYCFKIKITTKEEIPNIIWTPRWL